MRNCIYLFLICLLCNNINAQSVQSDLVLNSSLTTIDFTPYKDNLPNSIVNPHTIRIKKNSFKKITFDEVDSIQNQLHVKELITKPIIEKVINYKTINGFIIDSSNNTPIPNAVLKIFHETEVVYSTIKVDDEGYFEFKIPIDNKMFVEARHENFNVRYKKLVYHRKEETDFFRIYLLPLLKMRDLKVKKALVVENGKYKPIDISKLDVKLRKGKLILDMPELFFEINDDELSGRENNDILNNVIKLLADNPDLVIKISSHTDSRGPKEYLLGLSQRRAENIWEFMAKRGIESNRIEVKGNGFSDLLNDCDKEKKCSEKKHALNKRTEFEILNPIK